MLFIHLHKTFFLNFLCFPIYNNDTTKTIKNMSINEIKDCIFENYYKRIGFSTESSYYSMKRLKKTFIAAR